MSNVAAVTPPHQRGGPNPSGLTPEQREAKHAASARLEAFREEFKATHNGQAPTPDDYQASPDIFATVDAFNQLKSIESAVELAMRMGRGSDGSVVDIAESEREAASNALLLQKLGEATDALTPEQQQLKDAAGSTLTDFRGSFLQRHGRFPVGDDYYTQPEIVAAMETYNKLTAIESAMLLAKRQARDGSDGMAAASDHSHRHLPPDQIARRAEALRTLQTFRARFSSGGSTNGDCETMEDTSPDQCEEVQQLRGPSGVDYQQDADVVDAVVTLNRLQAVEAARELIDDYYRSQKTEQERK